MLRSVGDLPNGCGVALEVAPSNMFRKHLTRADRTYVGLDFDPAVDGRTVNVQASLTDVPLQDKSVDVAVIYHVLEHVPDDHSAMREIGRTLSDTGIAFLQVPWRPNVDTDEDLTVTDPDERTRRFGQADHVRYYGRDFDDRLAAAGVTAVRVLTGEIFPGDAVATFGLVAPEPIWICAATKEAASGIVSDLKDWGPQARCTYATDLLAQVDIRNRELRKEVVRLQQANAALTAAAAKPVTATAEPLGRRVRRRLGRAKRKFVDRS